MINIKKGNHTLKVSKNTYETMFKRLGYIIVDKKEEANKEASSKDNNINADTKNTSQDKELDNLLNNTDNLSSEEEKQTKNDSDENEGNLENIIGMLSNDNKENAKKNNGQTKNKEEK